ncbi:MAG: hypothetical protein JWR74_532 [Polaromonas sp.]|jgi:hypothetical protein|nr:hypothetical protein [Polaromonas sp.]
MLRLAFTIARFFSFDDKAASAGSNIARHLMEDAQARAGSNPYQARELRQAASAYLSVVR